MHRYFIAWRQVVWGKSVVLIAGAQIFTDLEDILKYLNTITLETTKLYPSDPELLKQVEELEALFNTQLGTAIQTWDYSYTFHNPKLAKC